MADELIDEQAVPSSSLIGIQFDFMTSGDIDKFSNFSVVEMNDVTHAKMGLPNGSNQCATCGSKNVKDCVGHSGQIKLPATIYHPNFLAVVVQILNQICPGCLSLKQNIDMKDCFTLEVSSKSGGQDASILKAIQKDLNGFGKKLLRLCKSELSAGSVLVQDSKIHISYLQKYFKVAKRWVRTDKQANCKYCSRSALKWYPAMRFKISSKDVLGKKTLSIVAEINEKPPKKFQGRSVDQLLPQDYWDFVPKDHHQQELNKSRITLLPHQAFYILKQLDREFIQQFVPRRELLFLSSVPVTANWHRVVEMSHGHLDGPQLSFDERTRAYKRMIDVSRRIDEFRQHQQFRALASSLVTNRVMECLNASKLNPSTSSSRLQLNPSTSSNRESGDISGLKWLKDVVLSKRSDNVFRSVMVGDPKINIDEIGIPLELAENLFVSEHVNAYNLEQLTMTCNLHLLAKDDLHIRRKGQLISVYKPNQLQIGDIVYRPLENKDLVLINRPPSVHQHSLISLTARILPIKSVVSINPLCCAPLLGDFDGDCLHGYIPQSIRCRVELTELVGLDHQLLNAQDGRSLVSLSHDSLTAAHILTGTEVFLNKYEMQNLVMSCPSPLPIPSIVKSSNTKAPFWTGQQLFSILLPDSLDFAFGSNRVHISKGELLSSPVLSSWLQNNTSGIFSAIFKSYGRDALDLLFCAQDVLCEYITMRGLSVSLSDLYLSPDDYSRNKLNEEVRLALEEAEDAWRATQLLLDPKLELIMKIYNKSEDLSDCVNDHSFQQNNRRILQASIAAFKEVFSDLQKMVHHHTNKDNSLLTMMHAGSKGSLLKLVQQSACLGLQLPGKTFPFTIPRKLSCVGWNNKKALEGGDLQNSVEGLAGQTFYAVIESSFLNGLNPVESLLHATSGRANCFSENAEVPGTLTRKLMFFLRDIYSAYDGTVRNNCGQQIVQFSYDTSEGEDVEAGAVAGARAACSISEAAYGALDHPINGLETSPLMDLKKVLKCGKGGYLDHSGTLFLSNRLRGYRYGYEYGALEIKSHLESVLFSDLIDTIMISYSGRGLLETGKSCWMTHFHLNKLRMQRKRLKLKSVIDKLTENYCSLREKSVRVIPALCIAEKSCSLIDQSEDQYSKFCITVAVETSEPTAQLDTIKDMVIPLLLKTVMKGFLEFKLVEIQPHPDSGGELFVKVAMSDSCLHGKFWSILQNACLPIMNLIDWERSFPNNVYDIFSVYGIDAAWKYFVQSLKSTTADIGRKVHRKHLLTVADCLSVSGEFHGLSAKGLSQQRRRLSMSSPFSQGCFSSPASCFVNAAKQGSLDKLSGTLDALAWGKEPPVGTAGPFEIMYASEAQTSQKACSIYQVLQNYNVKEPKQMNNVDCKHADPHISEQTSMSCSTNKGDLRIPMKSKDNAGRTYSWKQPNNKWKTQSKAQSAIVNGSGKGDKKTTLVVQQKFLTCKVGPWDNIVDMYTSLHTMLHKYPLGGYISETDKSSLIEALIYHPRGTEKIGSGVQEIRIGCSSSHSGSRCFILIRMDGTTEDFSYRKCVIAAAKQISDELETIVANKIFRR